MRESGILMHISSLPGPYGIGTMGKNAFEFVNFLEKYLPYLKDDSESANLKYITINMSLNQ